MTTTIHLAAGPLACDIRPDLGGCIAGLWLDGEPVLRSTPGPELQAVRLSGCYPLVPYSNRVAHATLQWNGTGHPLVQNNAPEPHAIHGVGWQRPWEVLDASDTFAMLSHEHRPDAAWPFAYDASQTFRLSRDALECTLSITNQSGQPAPAGLGWHPYFTKRAQSRVAFGAAGRWDMGADKLPTGLRPGTGLDAPCEALDVDHCFEGWSGEAALTDPRLRVRLSSDLRRLVVFTNATRSFIAIEPVSHVNNALGVPGADAASLGVRVLQPGESMTVHMSIAASAALPVAITHNNEETGS